jgi:HPt (histidine-containing phosphotransfer) domain-containing protein
VTGVKERCFDLGMQDFVMKPVETKALFTSLVKYIEEKKRDTPEIENGTLNMGDIELPKFQIINIVDGLRRVNHNKQLYSNLLIKFSKNYSNFITEIKKANTAGDKELVKRMLHTFKGVSGSLGATKLNKAAEHLEQQMVDDDSGIIKYLEDFEVAFIPVMEEVQHYAQQIEKQEVENKESDHSEMDVEKISQILDELKVQLADDDMDAKDTLKEIQKQNGIHKYKQLITEVEEKLEEYDFEEALEVVDKLSISIHK